MKNVQAEIISIGNEVLAGYTVNTNASFISQQLLTIGLPVNWITTVSDSHDEIITALKTAKQRANAVLVTGGLGPTPDDITKQAVCKFFDTQLEINEHALKNVQNFLEARGLRLSESNKNQAMLPACDAIIENPVGTAPGLVFRKDDTHFFFMPGVPKEMKYMTEYFILDYIARELHLPKVYTRLLRTTGIAESRLYEKLERLLNQYPQFPIAFLPRQIGVDLRFRMISDDKAIVEKFGSFVTQIKAEIRKYVFSSRNIELEQKVGEILTEKKLTLAAAESFTGGLFSDLITNVAGSSQYFLGGCVTYSNESKEQLLSAKKDTLMKYGAVSKETVREMVKGIQNNFKSDCAVATTGIAGPGGATETKPVGLCYVAVCYGEKEIIREFRFGTDRIINKRRGAIAGLEMLRRLLLNI